VTIDPQLWLSASQGYPSKLLQAVTAHCRSSAECLMTRCVSQDPETTKDPVEFVQRLLNEKDKYDAVIARSFGMDKSFQNSLNQAFEHFLNLNQRSPEFISLFMDDKLRKGLKARARPLHQVDFICMTL